MATEEAADSPLDFLLVNLTGQTIHAVFVSPHDSAGGEEDLLAEDSLKRGAVVQIRFNPSEQGIKWDIRTEDEKGRFAEWKDLDLRDVSSVTLRIADGVAIAQVE